MHTHTYQLLQKDSDKSVSCEQEDNSFYDILHKDVVSQVRYVFHNGVTFLARGLV